MVLEKFSYYRGKKKKTIFVKKVSIFSSGLMFKSKSPALLWELSKDKKFSIISWFCKPFTAIWLDKNRKITKIVDVKTWNFRISGRGKYLLEIPTRITLKE